MNILKLCCTSYKVNEGGEDWLHIMEEANKTWQAICQQLDSKELF